MDKTGSKDGFGALPWAEAIEPSPFAKHKVGVGTIHFWASSEKKRGDKNSFDQSADEKKIDRLLHRILILIIFEVQKWGVGGVNRMNLKKFIDSRFVFEANQSVAREKLLLWMLKRIKLESGLISHEYIDYLKNEKFKGAHENLRIEVKGKTFIGRFDGGSLSNLENISLRNAKVTGAIYNSSINHVDETTIIQKIEGDKSFIGKNDGIIWANHSLVENNMNRVEFNYGETVRNHGLIKNNERSGKIVSNVENAVVEVNHGLVGMNSGTLKDNPQGIVEINTNEVLINSGHININKGSVTQNISSITSNAGVTIRNIGSIENNSGKVEVNDNLIVSNDPDGVIDVNARGEVKDNNGAIITNEGSTLVNNNIIQTNSGKVEVNNENIDLNNGRVTSNVGKVRINEFLIETNSGSVTVNQKRVDNNEGSVESNEGVVIANKAGGVIGNEDNAAIISNHGAVKGKGMIIFHHHDVDGGDISGFTGEVKDDDPSKADIFDLL